MRRRPTAKLLMLLLVVTAVATFAGRGTGTTVCVPRERDVLLAFKLGITEDPAGRLASWRGGGDCCRWRGVRCSNRTGHVIQLRLRNSEAYHRDPLNIEGYHRDVLSSFGRTYDETSDVAMGGHISPSLFSLEHMEHLDLSGNWLDFPSDGHSLNLLGSLKRLRYLSLAGIGFGDGMLPPQLGNLSNHRYLDLSDTLFREQQKHISWLTHLHLLHHLDLSQLDLSNVHDWHHIVNMIPSLQVLYLSSCLLEDASQPLPHLNLTRLERLDLSDNNFDHPSKSCWFWNLTDLKYLNLGNNLFYGEFPSTLGQMSSLQVLDFSHNKHDDYGAGGIIPPRLMRNLCNLEVLNLEASLSYGNMVQLYESLPHCSPSRLRELYLDGNNIAGTLPAGISQFSSLVLLDLSFNHLTGYVPPEIGKLKNLTSIYLGHNNLTGTITEEHLSGLTSLRDIDLSYNTLKIMVDPGWLPPLKLESASFASCKMGPRFPSWLQRLVGIDYIDMSNTGIADQLPYWFSTTFSLATVLDFSNNKINGSLPFNMETMSLDSLRLDRNQLNGRIPPLPRNITCFTVSNNALSGRIPRTLCKSGNLKVLDLGNNHFEGEFPRCTEMRKLTDLILSNNMFTGKFPSFLQSCTDIAFLDLSGNKLCGRLPTWIGKLKGITYLRLSYNMFSGSIPSSMTGLRKMYDLNLAGNKLSGLIPWDLSSLRNMATNYDSSSPIYDLPVITKRQELYYRHTLGDMVTIDLSLNCLTGEIPEEITSLIALVNLNLSWNYLTGRIPHNIGSMVSLESLDLSRNELYGEIPSILSNLTYLSYLDLSYNNLSGRIPSGSQLDTLYDNNPYMYNNNYGLCGPPLQQNCLAHNINTTTVGEDDEKRNSCVPDPMFFRLGIGSGFVVGLWVVFCAMLFNERCRMAYLRLFDKVYDNLYVFGVLTWARLAEKALRLIWCSQFLTWARLAEKAPRLISRLG